MKNLLSYFMDFIFPPSAKEMEIRNLIPEKFYTEAKKAINSDSSSVLSIFDYRDELVKELIWQIKYSRNKHAIDCAAYAIYQKILAIDNRDNIVLIPIPISRKRMNERGYNQCEILVDAILKLDSSIKKNFNLLIRSKNIDKQTFKNRKDRIDNAKNVFSIVDNVKSEIKNREIIIIDDVTTTGSTILDAQSALKNAGFDGIRAITIAH